MKLLYASGCLVAACFGAVSYYSSLEDEIVKGCHNDEASCPHIIETMVSKNPETLKSSIWHALVNSSFNFEEIMLSSEMQQVK